MNSIKGIFATSEESGSWGKSFRDKRFLFYKQLINQIPKPMSILDVGGTEIFWENRGLAGDLDYQITLLNLEKSHTNYENIKSVRGNAVDMKEFSDQSQDLVFSNSVIEHVYTWENQVKMANEIMRIGKKHIIQTPNKFFLIEPHYVLPLFQFVPKNIAYPILTKTKLSRMQKWNPKDAKQYLDEIRLLSKDEMQRLFPQSSIYVERFLAAKKSFTAYNI